MRVLFATTAGAGHFGPLVPMARAGLGRRLGCGGRRAAEFHDTVRATRLVHLPFASPAREEMRAVFAGLESVTRPMTDRIVLTEVFGRLDAQAALPGLTAIVAAWAPDLVVREPCELGSLAAATAAGTPQVEVAIGMARLGAAFRAMLAEPLAELEAAARLSAGALTEPHTRVAITSVPACLDASDRGLINATYGLPPEPAHGPVWRHRTEVATAADLPPSWGDVERPVVYVTFGSVLSASACSTISSAAPSTCWPICRFAWSSPPGEDSIGPVSTRCRPMPGSRAGGPRPR